MIQLQESARIMMQYLSVHDLVWINTTLVGKPLPFDYQRLEEAMAAQYSYGKSTNVPLQAANLLDILVSKRPFAYGNRRTGFCAVTAFLNANGYALKVGDEEAARIMFDLLSGQISALQAIELLSEPAPIGLRPGATLRSLLTHIFNAHADAIQRLREGDE